MLEFLGLLFVAAAVGVALLVGWLLLLPFYLLFRLLGFALKLTFGGLLLVLCALIVFPIALVFGALLLLKLLLIGIPLLLLGLLVYGLVWFLRPAPA